MNFFNNSSKSSGHLGIHLTHYVLRQQRACNEKSELMEFGIFEIFSSIRTISKAFSEDYKIPFDILLLHQDSK